MRRSIQRSIVLAGAALLAAAPLPPPAAAQPRAERAFCWAGRPAESCRAFLVAEGNAYVLAAGSTYRRYGYGHDEVTRERHLVGHVGWELGAMTNVGPRDAVGATLLVGGDANGVRVGLKGRYRRWMGRRAAMDVGAGVLHARRAEPFPQAERRGNHAVAVTGLTGDVAVGLTDWASVSVRGDLLWDADGRPATGVYGGLKLGTRPAIAATVVPIAAALVAVLAANGRV